MSKKLVIFGIDNMARMAHFYFTNDSDYEVVGFCVDPEYIDGDEHRGLPLVSFDEVEQRFSPDDHEFFVAIGYKKLNRFRTEKYHAAKEKGYRLATYLSSKATHWGETKIGDNCFILENQVLQPGITIGNNVIIWSGCHFGHDVVIGDNCFFSSHVVVCGGVEFGPNCFIGGNAFIRDAVVIAEENIVGAQTVILANTKPKQVFVAEATKPYRLTSEQFMRFLDISN